MLSVLLQDRSAKRLGSRYFGRGPNAKYGRASAFCFFFFLVCLFVSVHSHGFCGGMNIFSQEKRQHVNVHRHVVTKSEISIDQRMQLAVILLSN